MKILTLSSDELFDLRMSLANSASQWFDEWSKTNQEIALKRSQKLWNLYNQLGEENDATIQ